MHISNLGRSNPDFENWGGDIYFFCSRAPGTLVTPLGQFSSSSAVVARADVEHVFYSTFEWLVTRCVDDWIQTESCVDDGTAQQPCVKVEQRNLPNAYNNSFIQQTAKL